MPPPLIPADHATFACPRQPRLRASRQPRTAPRRHARVSSLHACGLPTLATAAPTSPLGKSDPGCVGGPLEGARASWAKLFFQLPLPPAALESAHSGALDVKLHLGIPFGWRSRRSCFEAGVQSAPKGPLFLLATSKVVFLDILWRQMPTTFNQIIEKSSLCVPIHEEHNSSYLSLDKREHINKKHLQYKTNSYLTYSRST